uniref:Uncharacterized protein n=1 Tax=Opuntia streptacantha TaxID=393608 RepID=A0A7C9EH06_OPUST
MTGDWISFSSDVPGRSMFSPSSSVSLRTLIPSVWVDGDPTTVIFSSVSFSRSSFRPLLLELSDLMNSATLHTRSFSNSKSSLWKSWYPYLTMQRYNLYSLGPI